MKTTKTTKIYKTYLVTVAQDVTVEEDQRFEDYANWDFKFQTDTSGIEADSWIEVEEGKEG